MNKIIKKIYSIILFCSSILLMSSCTTTGSYFTENQQRENNRKFMLQQQQQQEELAREMFRIKVNQALSITASSLTIELYNNLGQGEVAENDFGKENINYYYQNETADCPLKEYDLRLSP